jgi:hypothetical protein
LGLDEELAMCALCGLLSAEDDWTARHNRNADERAPEHRRLHARRIQLLNDVLSFYHLHIADWQGKMLVTSPTGGAELVSSLAEVWTQAERLSKRSIDPLDPALLSQLAVVRV